jgi:2-alkyl-3-oxoalkanoate reductase
MRVFVAGATGAIGSPLVVTLIRRGHEVIGTTRSVERARALEHAGATPMVVDALDPVAVKGAVAEAESDAIVHELTAIPPGFNPRASTRRSRRRTASARRARTI